EALDRNTLLATLAPLRGGRDALHRRGDPAALLLVIVRGLDGFEARAQLQELFAQGFALVAKLGDLRAGAAGLLEIAHRLARPSPHAAVVAGVDDFLQCGGGLRLAEGLERCHRLHAHAKVRIAESLDESLADLASIARLLGAQGGQGAHRGSSGKARLTV